MLTHSQSLDVALATMASPPNMNANVGPQGVFGRELYKWAFLFAAATLISLFFATGNVLQGFFSGKPLSWPMAFSHQAAYYYLWLALAPLIFWLSLRVTPQVWGWTGWVGTHLVAAAVFSLIQLALYGVLIQLIPAAQAQNTFSFTRVYRILLVYYGHVSMLLYWSILGLSYFVAYYRKARERELRASQLETLLAQAQLQALRLQLHPHFLFNTLNTIAELVHTDAEAADLIIGHLSDLLRVSLDNFGMQEVPLRQELAFLNRYLAIEQTRFQERLRVSVEVAPEVLDEMVPNMILQPLVENAIRHGISPRATGGSVEIRACTDDGSLLIRISDDGCGLPQSLKPALRQGVGLDNTRARLFRLYGEHHQFNLKNIATGGLLVELVLPRTRISPA